jgi:hypothetical protein
MADFPIALPPSVIVLRIKSSLSELNVWPSFKSGGVGDKIERLDGPAGVALAWHQTQLLLNTRFPCAC